MNVLPPFYYGRSKEKRTGGIGDIRIIEEAHDNIEPMRR